MKYLLILSILLLPLIQGCAVGSATAAYAVKSGSADELSNKGRDTIVKEAVEKAKAYADENFVKKGK